MESMSIKFSRAYLKVILKDVAKYFTKDEIRSAKLGQLSCLNIRKRFEFWLPSSPRMTGGPIRIETYATNAYIARAKAWEAILSYIDDEYEDARAKDIYVFAAVGDTFTWLNELKPIS